MKTIDWSSTPQVTTSTTTSCSYPCQYSQVQIQYGWECPRCHTINAPWASKCSCTENNNNTYRITTTPNLDQWAAINNSKTNRDTNGATTYSITMDRSDMVVGGSDFYNTVTRNWENVPHTLTNLQEETDGIKSKFNNTLRGE